MVEIERWPIRKPDDYYGIPPIRIMLYNESPYFPAAFEGKLSTVDFGMLSGEGTKIQRLVTLLAVDPGVEKGDWAIVVVEEGLITFDEYSDNAAVSLDYCQDENSVFVECPDAKMIVLNATGSDEL